MLSQYELERRRQFITATDVPAIIGVNKYKNAADIFIEKTQSVRLWDGNAATEAGNLLEPAILAWAKTRLGHINDGDWRVHENGVNACTLDGMLPNGEPVECKSHGIVGPADFNAWGKDGTDDIPDVYGWQVQAQMFVTGAPRTWIPALIGGRGFVLYVMERHDDMQELIEGASARFWKQVQERRPPDGVPHIDIMERMDRIAGKVVQVDDLVAVNYLKACEEARIANEAKDAAKEALLATFGDADGAKWNGGEFSYKTQIRKPYTVKESSFRVLRSKSPKKEDE